MKCIWAWQEIFAQLLDFIYPPSCLHCQQSISSRQIFCDSCQSFLYPWPITQIKEPSLHFCAKLLLGPPLSSPMGSLYLHSHLAKLRALFVDFLIVALHDAALNATDLLIENDLQELSSSQARMRPIIKDLSKRWKIPVLKLTQSSDGQKCRNPLFIVPKRPTLRESRWIDRHLQSLSQNLVVLILWQ